MSRPKVILDPAFRRLENIFTARDLERLHGIADVVWGKNEEMPAAEIEAVKSEVAAIITGHWRHGEVASYPNLKAIMEVSGGLPSPDAVDYQTCFARGIRVLSCAPAFGPAVAELGLGLAIASSRQIVSNHEGFRKGEANWSHVEDGGAFTLYGKQMGFIGFGGLARSLQKLVAPFECPIQVYDPWLTDTYLRDQGVEPVELERLLKTSRFIFVLAVPSASNKAMIDRELLAAIPKDSIFVLLSRSHVVDFDALTEFLLKGQFKAAIDVFPQEPLRMEHPIRQAQNVIFSSHRAGAIGEALQNIGRIVVNDLEAVLNDLMPQYMQAAQPEFIKLRSRRT